MPSFKLPFGVEVLNPVPTDTRRGPYVATTEAAAKALAVAAVPSGVRGQGQQVDLIIAGVNSVYVWKNGVADSDLIPLTTPLPQNIATTDSPTWVDVHATRFIKTGGTSSQFLMADGSSNSNNYQLTTERNASNGYAGLDSSGLIPASLLPSSVDAIAEYATLSAFPATGETNKIYVALDTNKTYRWGGSSYVEISSSPGTTDDVAEGSVNLYYKDSRVASYGNTVYPQLTTTYTNPGWISSLAWGKITSTPTTIAGYGITDAYTKGQTDAAYQPKEDQRLSTSNSVSFNGLTINGVGGLTNTVSGYTGGAAYVGNIINYPVGYDAIIMQLNATSTYGYRNTINIHHAPPQSTTGPSTSANFYFPYVPDSNFYNLTSNYDIGLLATVYQPKEDQRLSVANEPSFLRMTTRDSLIFSQPGSGFKLTVYPFTMNADRVQNYQNKNGTIALVGDIPTAVSQISNDSGYITSSALGPYVLASSLGSAAYQNSSAFYSSSNPSGYINSYSETSTLATVISRGAATNGNIDMSADYAYRLVNGASVKWFIKLNTTDNSLEFRNASNNVVMSIDQSGNVKATTFTEF